MPASFAIPSSVVGMDLSNCAFPLPASQCTFTGDCASLPLKKKKKKKNTLRSRAFFLLAMLSELATDDAYCLNLSMDSSPPGRYRNSSVYTKNLGFLGLSRPGWWRWSTLGCPDNGSSRWLDYFSEREILINYSDIVISLSGLALTQGPGMHHCQAGHEPQYLQRA